MSRPTTLLVLLSLALLVSPNFAQLQMGNETKSSQSDLGDAIRELRAASYYAFIFFLQLIDERLPTGATFLMPNDTYLANIPLNRKAVMSFMMHHTIPSPLSFDDLLHFPTGSLIPSFLSNYVYNVSNHGRKNFSLNHVHIIRPDICKTTPAIQCHGIDRVITSAFATYPANPPRVSESPMDNGPPVLEVYRHHHSPAAGPSGLDSISPMSSAAVKSELQSLDFFNAFCILVLGFVLKLE